MNLENRNTMEALLDEAKKLGAESADVIFSTGKSLSMSAQEGELDSYKVSGSKIAGIRVIKDQKVGISYTEAFDKEALIDTAKKAIENSRYGEVNEHEVIDNALEEDLVHMGEVEQAAVEDLSPQEKIDICLKLESEVKAKDKRVSGVPYNGLSEGSGEGYYLNSLGTFCYDFEHYVSCYSSALIKDGAKNSMHYHGTIGKHYQDLNWGVCVEESFKHALNWLDAGPIKSGRYDVIFSTDEFQSLFGAFRGIFSGKRAQEKKNPFSEKLGKIVAHKELSVLDSPMYKQSIFKSPFDSEGYIRKELELIEGGEFKCFLHNSVTSKYFGVENTFRASRSARSALGVGGTTTVVKAGTSSEKDLQSGEYLEIHSMQGLHSGLNFMSGDFSFGASGYLCKDGERIKSVNGITVAGNFYKMLEEIAGLGDSIKQSSGRDFFAPDIRFASLSVAGA